jgi:RNA recognition motif-containing protein
VTNLPFSVDDAGLSAIFAGLNIKSAHVVRKHNERSKGFGFVEFNSADDQQKALQAINNKNVDGRELVVKVALTEVARNNGSPAAAPAADTK